ncbi:MAG: VanZ family protein [Oscillospiraceae bacterium]|nr:VanZ family protein [Oscillospiraceae bacterium]
MIRTRKRMILCIALLLAVLAFIWGNSLTSGEDSGALSGSIMEWINTFLRLDEQGAETLHHLIRKMAHFTEFACLGLLLTWLFGMMGEKKGHLFCMPLLFGMLAACADETIQVFVPDRGPSPVDIWIDTCGVTAGIIAVLIGYHLLCKKLTHTNLEETT